ncbi:hypothetical protein THAOC_32532, partial [Thalassiosira oceanica]
MTSRRLMHDAPAESLLSIILLPAMLPDHVGHSSGRVGLLSLPDAAAPGSAAAPPQACEDEACLRHDSLACDLLACSHFALASGGSTTDDDTDTQLVDDTTLSYRVLSRASALGLPRAGPSRG